LGSGGTEVNNSQEVIRNLRGDVQQLQNQVSLQHLMDGQRAERDYREINMRQSRELRDWFSNLRK
jgi:hypothetical protein